MSMKRVDGFDQLQWLPENQEQVKREVIGAEVN
jgi:hypothetical protein